MPVTHDALMQAIALNGVALDMNRRAFLWGRRAAHDLAAVQRFTQPQRAIPIRPPTLDTLVAKRVEFLSAYQDAAYAERYRLLVAQVQEAETLRVGRHSSRLAETVARAYFKLLAYKDEYEVARLYTDSAFWEKVHAAFEGDFDVRFHLAPPLVSRLDPLTGRVPKKAYGEGMLRMFRILAKLKGLRGTRWDPFGRTAERRAERALIAEYERDIAELLDTLGFTRLALALEIAALPEDIRGFGHVKMRNMALAARKRERLLARWRSADRTQARVA